MKKTLLLSFLSIIAINGLTVTKAQAFDWNRVATTAYKIGQPAAQLTAGAGFAWLSFYATRVGLYTGINLARSKNKLLDDKLYSGVASAACFLNGYIAGNLATEFFGSFANNVKAAFTK